MPSVSYPAPDVPYQGYSDLHFATEEQVRSRLTLAGYDRGELTLSPGRLVFRGMTVLVDCPGVTGVRLVRKRFPWAVALVVMLVTGFLATVREGRFPPEGHLPQLGLILLAIIVKQLREKWVEVTYAGPEGPSRAYFRRQPIFVGSATRRTVELLAEIREKVLDRA